jgi:hypothetical protein
VPEKSLSFFEPIPQLAEVYAWAAERCIPQEWAAAKWHSTTENHRWYFGNRLVDWRTKWQRFWFEDRAGWEKKHKKNLVAASAEPSDLDQWWTMSVGELRTLRALVAESGSPRATRLGEIIEIRSQNN